MNSIQYDSFPGEIISCAATNLRSERTGRRVRIGLIVSMIEAVKNVSSAAGSSLVVEMRRRDQNQQPTRPILRVQSGTAFNSLWRLRIEEFACNFCISCDRRPARRRWSHWRTVYGKSFSILAHNMDCPICFARSSKA